MNGLIRATRQFSLTCSKMKLNNSSSTRKFITTEMDLIVRYFDGRPEELYQYHEIDNLLRQHSDRKTRSLLFITGNKYKVEELQDNIKSSKINIQVQDLNIPEIQDNDELNIVIDKCRSAFKMLNKLSENNSTADNATINEHKAVLVEDTCLHFKALEGMPGPYIKSFVQAIGPEGLHKMLTGFEDKSAQATCVYALMDDLSKVILCRGTVRGKIISPRGASWGWDPVFEEERSGMTFGEMGPELKAKFSHRSNAITVLRKYLTSGQSTFS